MSLCLKKSLRKLKRLAPEKLHGVNLRIRRDLGGCEWKMGVCLLATARSKRYLDLGYASLNEYAEKSLKLSSKKAYLLMLTARALEHLPLFSAAYQEGLLCWGKLRALQSVVTPETERTWLAYSLEHNSTQVVSAVAMSPRAWKKQQGLNGSLKQKPFVAPPDVEQVFDKLAEEQAREAREKALKACPDSRAPEAQTPGVASRLSGPGLDSEAAVGREREASSGENAHESFPTRDSFEGEERPFAPPTLANSAARKIRVTVEFTPDQYAIFEQSERCAKAQIGGRVDRAATVVRMCEAHLAATTSRTRLKYQVVVHTSTDGDHGWYETAQGPLPASPEAVQQARSQDAKRGQYGEADPPANSATKPPQRVKRAEPARRAKGDDSTGPSSAEAAKIVVPPSETPATSAGSTEAPLSNPRPGKKPKRENVPAATLRALYLRAGHRCERCGCSNGGLHVHHRRPVCEGGDSSLGSLELLCGPCHSGHHESDYQIKPTWQAARSKAVARGQREPSPQAPLSRLDSTSPPPPLPVVPSHH